MKSLIKKLLVFLSYYSGLSQLKGLFLKDKLFLIGYHSIWSKRNEKEFLRNIYENISISEDSFERQLLFLKNNGHTFVHFSDLNNQNSITYNKPTIIFFDDGFRDVYINALPILKKHNIKATIFITTGLVDKTDFLWTLSLRYFLSKKQLPSSDIEKKIKEFKRFSMAEREQKIKELFAAENFSLNPKEFNIFLGWDDIKILQNENFEIGSHGISHQKLIELSPVFLDKELSHSKRILEEKNVAKINFISYPYGRFNKEVENAVYKAGYSLGVSTIAGVNTIDDLKSSPFRLKRITPEPEDTLSRFVSRLYMNF